MKKPRADDHVESDLCRRLDPFIAQQTTEWSLLRDSHATRAREATKTMMLGRFPIQVHCNPARIGSTTADVDAASVKQRECRLCADRWLEGQRGLTYDRRLTILCNPFPVLERHLTVVDSVHVPQAIEGRIASLLNLTQDLDAFVVFYNGPLSGASTPEHFHVQAVPREGVPLLSHMTMTREKHALQPYRHQLGRRDGVEVFVPLDYYARLVVLRSGNAKRLETCVYQTLEQFANLHGTRREPAVNLLLGYANGSWEVFLYPRSNHRPRCYYDGTLTVSPASLDMAGCLVVPIQEQFDHLCPEQIAHVYSEVTLQRENFEEFLSSL